MEAFLLLLALLVLGLPIASMIVAASAMRRNRDLRRDLHEFAETNSKIIQSLRQEISQLKRQVSSGAAAVAAATRPISAAHEPVAAPDAAAAKEPAAPAVPSQPIVAPVPPARVQPPEPAKRLVTPPAPVPPAPAPTTTPMPLISVVVSPSAPAEVKTPAPAQPAAPPWEQKPAAAPPPPKPAPPRVPPPAAIPPAPQQQQPVAARISTPRPVAPLRIEPQRLSWKERLKAILDLEEVLGANWLLKLGVILLVLGIALFGILELSKVGSFGKVLASYATAVTMLAGGIYLEKRERYNLIGRVSIGGGWALFFFTTFAMHHVAAMQVIPSQPLDLALMLLVAGAMTLHTLRYRSQLVTGFAFLLGYSTVALAQDTVYALSAGAVLGIGLVAIVYKMGWYELEVFGILSAYLDHLYWLYRLFEANGLRGHLFPEYRASTGLLLFYWLIFRVSYVIRGIKSDFEERVSTVAAILNALLLLATMKYQSAQPQLAWIALLAVGGLEFSIANFPITRQRREAFILLSVLGTALMVIAVPMHYTDNAALLWLAGAEVFLIAGITMREVVFRRLGLAIGLLVGLRLAIFNFQPLMHFRESSEALVLSSGILFGLCAVVFYVNVAGGALRWRELFSPPLDRQLLVWQSYAGGFAAAASVWAFLSKDWTAVGFAGLMVILAVLSRKLSSSHQQIQFVLAGGLVLVRIFSVNLHIDSPAGMHVTARIITLPLLAAAFYVTAKLAALGEGETQRILRGLFAAAGTSLIAALIYLEVPEYWQPLAAIALGVSLAEASEWLRYRALAVHAHVISFLAVMAALTTHRPATLFWHGISHHALAAAPVVLGAYWLAWRFNRSQVPSSNGVRDIYTWAAAGLIFALVWTEANDTWTAVAYLAFGILFALAGRRWSLPHLGYQENIFALAAVSATFQYNFHLTAHYGHFSVRLITVSLVAAGLYAISRKGAQAGAAMELPIAYLHTTAATTLLAVLMYYEASSGSGWLAATWALFALALAATDRRFELDDLCWQAHGLAALALIRSLGINLHITETWHGVSVRLLSLAIVAVILYAMSRVVRMPEELREQDLHHVYSWAASTLVSLMLWYELEPLSKAVGWAVFGLVLFQYGMLRKIVQFRYQAYVAFTAAFARIFFANLTAGAAGEFWGPRLYTVAPLILIFFFVYAQLSAEPEAARKAAEDGSRMRPDSWFAYLGTASLAALLYFQVVPEWVITSWAIVVCALLALALLLDRVIFLHQGLLLTLGVFARGMAHNLFGASHFTGNTWTGRYFVVSSAAGALLAALPFAFRLRDEFGNSPAAARWKRAASAAVRRPEQLLFFAPMMLMTFMLALKMSKGMITISWGIEGLIIILLALAVGERSFRLAGLGLLLVCVGKVIALDFWRLQQKEDRYLTMIVLGAALVTVSFLYTRYREAIRRYL